MSARRPCPGDVRVCSERGLPATKKVRATGQSSPAPRLRLRRWAMALALIAMLALIFLPPALITPSGGVQLVAAGVLTLLGCVLVAVICYESRRR